MASKNSTIDYQAIQLFEGALEQPVNQQEDWIRAQAGSREELCKKALRLLLQDRQPDSVMYTGRAGAETIDDTAMPERIGAYKINQLIGRGGMGAVYRGERDTGDFDHDAAIKVIRSGVMSKKLIERFQLERQTLADLAHPNIARLYDGGTLKDGAPYIIMEYIDGAAITDWANSNSLSRRARLTLFLKTCEAVSYAHQNQIVHRDITPSNVLVTKEGEVKLIDFGIAKPYAETVENKTIVNSLASLSFTPGFAAPERSQGAHANTLSDIYSLGKLLNALLNENNEPELKAIIAKATANMPEERYNTVNALIDDITNYTTGRPVEIFSATSSYKLKKFIARHKTGAFLTGVAVLVLVGAFVTTLVQYQRAEIARKEANARFEEVRELANFMLFDLYDRLKIVPGNTKSLSDIADKSRSYLDALAKDERASLDLRLETAIGYKRLSDVLGNPITSNLGRREETAELINKAYTEMELLLAQNPNDVNIMRALAQAAYSFAVYEFIAEDDNADTLKYSKRSEALYAAIIDTSKGTDEDQIGKLRASLEAAKTYYWDGKGAEGIVILKALTEEVRAYVDRPDASVAARSASAAIHTQTGLTISSHYSVAGGDANEAVPYLNDAIDIYKSLDATDTSNSKHKRDMVGAYYKRALIYSGVGNNEAMLADLNMAESIAGIFLDKDPDDTGMLRIALAVGQLKSKTLSNLGRYDEALDMGRRILERLQELYVNEPDSPGRARELANAFSSQASIMDMAGRKTEACIQYQSSLSTWKTIQARWGINEFDKKDGVEKAQNYVSACP